MPDVAANFRFPFGCPVIAHKIGERDHHYDANCEFGIAVGSSQGSNRATLVYMPGKGTRAWERLDVRALKMQHHGAATELQKQDLAPVIGGDWRAITFKSSAPALDLSTPRNDDERVGTLGFSSFDVASHSLIRGRATTTTTTEGALAELPGMRITRSIATSSSTDPPPVHQPQNEDASQHDTLAPADGAAVLSAYFALYSSSGESSPPDLATDSLCYATKMAVRTSDNPTFGKASKGTDWALWQPVVEDEMGLLSPEQLHCYDVVRPCEVPRGTRILQSKMDL